MESVLIGVKSGVKIMNQLLQLLEQTTMVPKHCLKCSFPFSSHLNREKLSTSPPSLETWRGYQKQVLSDVENLTENKIEDVLNRFLEDMKENSLETKGWPAYLSGYMVSRAALNGYTRILAKKQKSFCINAYHPGFVKTDMTYNAGKVTADEGAQGAVRLALLPNASSPSGLFFRGNDEFSF